MVCLACSEWEHYFSLLLDLFFYCARPPFIECVGIVDRSLLELPLLPPAPHMGVCNAIQDANGDHPAGTYMLNPEVSVVQLNSVGERGVGNSTVCVVNAQKRIMGTRQPSQQACFRFVQEAAHHLAKQSALIV